MNHTRARTILCGSVLLFSIGAASPARSAVVTENDSTQPRGAPSGVFNTAGQDLSPIEKGFHSHAYLGFFPQHADWAGMTMANAMRDPNALAQLSVSNQDFITYSSSIPGDPADPDSPVYQFLKSLKLEQDVTTRGPNGRLQPRGKVPVIADLCLRCHNPAGWLEGLSEPPTQYSPFLKGQFWAGAFLEYPGFIAPVTQEADPSSPPLFFRGDYWAGPPTLADFAVESEGGMDGVTCYFCHRALDNFKRQSLFDGSTMANGNGGFFVQKADETAFQHVFTPSPHFCGTCHDVTNPLFKTRTEVDGTVPDMLHPIERTYTEWFWSDYNGGLLNLTCQQCHAPMKFLGPQTWLLYPGLDALWGALDTVWTESPFGYAVTASRAAQYEAAANRNRDFMSSAALVDVTAGIDGARKLTATVKVTNLAGHKLPTGYPEGRQMWINVQALDADQNVFFEDGKLNKQGKLVRTKQTKVYECIHEAEGYSFPLTGGPEFHFVLNNKIVKDNRIPPVGFNKAAYQADGAFIIPRDPGDTDYPDGQYWDETTYSIPVPANVHGDVTVRVRLMYEAMNAQYAEFLSKVDKEKTVRFGGVARSTPDGPFQDYPTWGSVIYKLWADNAKGKPADADHVTNVVVNVP